nr:hypothetical protein [Tanacetum cinerariifolium]
MTLLNKLMETCATLTQKVANLEQDKIAQALEITKLKQRVKKLEKKRNSNLLDTDEAEPAKVEEVLEVVTTAKLMTERIDEDAEDLKRHLQIVANEDDDVYTEATPLALKNFDREDLEALWKLVKERFKSTEPKNFSDEFLLNTLKIMFEKPNIKANMILLVGKKYPLTHFTLEQMLNNVSLEVEKESEMSLELLRLVRR